MEKFLVISSLEAGRKKKDRYNVYIDGEYTASLNIETCITFGIKPGIQITEETLKEAILCDNTQYAFDRALHLLSHKMRTKQELFSRLSEKGLNEEAIDAAIDKLIGYGYVNDTAYAKEYVESAITAGKYGRKVVKYKLKEKGIRDEIIKNVLEAYTYDIEKKIILTQLDALQRRYRNEDIHKKRQKIYATLSRRGFSYDIISTLLNGEETL